MDIQSIIDPNIPELSKVTDQRLEIENKKAQTLVMFKESENEREFVLTNLYGLIAQGNNALMDLAVLCAKSEHPRTYEVLASLIKTLAEVNKDVIEVVNKTKEEEAKTVQKQTNNNLFVGSTSEMAMILKQMQK